MTEPQIRLYLAPAASGKTAHVLDLARAAARELGAIPRIVVSTQLQVRALRRRLAPTVPARRVVRHRTGAVREGRP